jgi:hypothetical protein
LSGFCGAEDVSDVAQEAPARAWRARVVTRPSLPLVLLRADGKGPGLLGHEGDKAFEGVDKNGEIGVGRGRRRALALGRWVVGLLVLGDDALQALGERLDEWEDEVRGRTAKVGGGHEEEVDPVVDDGAIMLSGDALAEDADE